MRRADLLLGDQLRVTIVAAACAFAAFAIPALAQQTHYPKPTDLPNPYRLVQGWPTLPTSMNGGHWGEVSRVHVDQKGNIWVFHRCFATMPAGSAVCLGPYANNPPILEFDPTGRLLTSLGTGLFVYPHGLTVDNDGNLWTTDVNDKATVLGMSTKNADGVQMGQEALKISPTTGKVLMMLGKEGVTGNGPNTFDRPPGIAVAPNGDIFVSDGHLPNALNASRIVKFDKDGHFIKSWGHVGPEPGNFDEPHDICIGGSQNRVFVADRKNKRIQVFDQDGNFIAAWSQFGEPNSIFVGKDDTLYAGVTFDDPNESQPAGTPHGVPMKGELRGIMIGSARDGSLKAFIPDPVDLNSVVRGSSASGIAADDNGNIYAADVGAHNLRKYALEGHL
jgi:DNA-binding beta-propeller fold protein YncE